MYNLPFVVMTATISLTMRITQSLNSVLQLGHVAMLSGRILSTYKKYSLVYVCACDQEGVFFDNIFQ